MPSKRKPLRHGIAMSLLASLAVLLLPAGPAGADIGQPPFELRFPQEIVATHYSSTFGAPRSGGRRHEGNDLMAPKMTEVYAAAAGIVDTITVSGNAGRYLTINHAGGWSTTYMHLNNDTPGTDDGSADWGLTVVPGIEVGTVVFSGQLIGYVGDSGNAEWTGSHTHFELRHNGVAVNPYYLLREAESRALNEGLDHLWRLATPLEPDQMT
jgi:murein DD-endopeptidase MepM/ murein hydrolase activator NlpD